jgi:hypothetical protein
MAHIDPALVQQILNIAQRQRKADIKHHRKADHLGRCLEVAEGISHPSTLPGALALLKLVSSDNAFRLAHSKRRSRRAKVELSLEDPPPGADL